MSTEPAAGPRVLVVDDDEALRKVYKRALSNQGYRVETVPDGSAALAAIERVSFDVILSDLDLPKMDGIALLSLVRQADVDVPVIVITGKPSLETAITAMERGAMRYLVKPIELSILVGVVADALRVHRAATARRQAMEAARSALVQKERAEERAAGAEAAQQTILGTLDAIMESAPAFIIAVDVHGKIQFINKVMDSFKKEEVIGSDFLLYLPPKDHDEQRARLRRIVETGVPENYETTIVVPGAETTWFSAHMAPMRAGDKIVGAVLVSQDMTELKRAQADFAGAQRLAAIGTLAAGIAHEINTPVQFINDSVHFLREVNHDVFGLLEKLSTVCRLAAAGANADELRSALTAVAEAEDEADLIYLRENVPKAFERCVDGLQCVSTIVRSMKEFAHPAQRDMASIDLNRAIQNTLTIAHSEYKYVAELETEFGDLPLVNCHINDINQVVLNLVVNAAHAVAAAVKDTDKKGIIRVRTEQDGENVRISISDTGTGIPEGIAHRIFEPFFTTKGVGEGTGQGLALVWSIVKGKHGGDLKFISKVGEGTTFFIRLPISGLAQKEMAGALD